MVRIRVRFLGMGLWIGLEFLVRVSVIIKG